MQVIKKLLLYQQKNRLEKNKMSVISDFLAVLLVQIYKKSNEKYRIIYKYGKRYS